MSDDYAASLRRYLRGEAVFNADGKPWPRTPNVEAAARRLLRRYDGEFGGASCLTDLTTGEPHKAANDDPDDNPGNDPRF